MVVGRFHLLTIDHEITADGFIVTITTNTPCHLYLRYSKVYPRIHRKSVLRRGVVFGWDARFCFVSYQHIEQNEDGDTITHTFTWPDWENCWTRYFYFWGTKTGFEMASDSPIFWLHYLWTAVPPPDQTIFYSDPHPELTSVDGTVWRVSTWDSWAAYRNGDGTGSQDDGSGLDLRIRCGSGAPPNNYYELYRAIALYDLSIGLGAQVASAKIHLWASSKADTADKKPTFALSSSAPASNIALVPSDYQTLGNTHLAVPIPYDDFILDSWVELTLNPVGIAHINAALASDGIVKFGFREGKYDLDDVPPFPGLKNSLIYLGALAVDTADPTKRPYLEVVWVQP